MARFRSISGFHMKGKASGIYACEACQSVQLQTKTGGNCEVCGKRDVGFFASKGEYKRWQELLLMKKAGMIRKLKRQVKVPLYAARGGEDYARPIYAMSVVVDFHYVQGGKEVYEDYKAAPPTETFKLKAAFFKAQFGFPIYVQAYEARS